jgi:uncharacterized protein YjbJ (UPF0337 family)
MDEVGTLPPITRTGGFLVSDAKRTLFGFPGCIAGSDSVDRKARGGNMSEPKDTGPEAGAKGVVEDVKGKVKEAAGALSGKDHLREEGRAQQDKAAAERDVAVNEAKAEKSRAEAEAHEAEQRAHQN